MDGVVGAVILRIEFQELGNVEDPRIVLLPRGGGVLQIDLTKPEGWEEIERTIEIFEEKRPRISGRVRLETVVYPFFLGSFRSVEDLERLLEGLLFLREILSQGGVEEKKGSE